MSTLAFIFLVKNQFKYFPLLHFKENVTSLVSSKIGSLKMCCKLSTGVSTGLYELLKYTLETENKRLRSQTDFSLYNEIVKVLHAENNVYYALT
jgi:hypothetical protein